MTPTNLASRSVDRRGFLKAGALAGGGLLIGTYVHFGVEDAFAESTTPAAAGEFAPNAFLSIAPTGAITIIAPNSEMGQGIKTGLPMIVAEELDADWSRVTIQQGDLNPIYGRQFSVGSGSTVANWMPLRRAGATARAMLIAAAAQSWNAPASECTTEKGFVVHAASKRRLSYGDLASKAGALPIPTDAPLKDPKDFTLLGTRVAGVDNAKIVTGQPLFGIDVKLPGMLYATFAKCPVFGGSVASANVDEIKKRPGVKDAFVIDNVAGVTSGVAIVADSTWNAISAKKALVVKWNEGPVASQGSAEMAKQAEQLAKATPPDAPAAEVKRVEATYHYPFLAHATLEPQNCTALFKSGTMEMWTPTQIPSAGQGLVARACNLPPANVVVHITRLGGGFGRRGSNEFSPEAAVIAQRMPGTPVKLQWMREDDFAHDNYRSNGWHFFAADLDRSGKVAYLHDAFVKMEGGPGDMSAREFPFTAVAGAKVASSKLPAGIPTGYWRAPGANGNTWATQCYVDELAHAAGRDAKAFTLDLLDGVPAAGAGGRGPSFDREKMKAVLNLATEKAGWGKSRPRGEGQGFAVSYANGAYVAIVADVTVSKAGELSVQKLTAAVDCGTVINMSAAEAQIQGSMLDGISAAWFQKILIEHGGAAQTNFDEYPMMRMRHSPRVVEVHFIRSTEPPTGLGEPGLPAAAPAVCNAIFAATGKRVRTLPIADTDLSWS